LGFAPVMRCTWPLQRSMAPQSTHSTCGSPMPAPPSAYPHSCWLDEACRALRLTCNASFSPRLCELQLLLPDALRLAGHAPARIRHRPAAPGFRVAVHGHPRLPRWRCKLPALHRGCIGQRFRCAKHNPSGVAPARRPARLTRSDSRPPNVVPSCTPTERAQYCFQKRGYSLTNSRKGRIEAIGKVVAN
jgi:hypothetical protein